MFLWWRPVFVWSAVQSSGRWLHRGRAMTTDLKLDHVDAEAEWEEPPPARSNPSLTAEENVLERAIRARGRRREVIEVVGRLLDEASALEQPSKRKKKSALRTAAERRYADAIVRCARDACLASAWTRHRNARDVQQVWRQRAFVDLSATLASVGRLQQVLFALDDPKQAMNEAALALGCNITSLSFASIGDLVVATADAMTRERAGDEDARLLRRRARRRVIVRCVALAAVCRGLIGVRNFLLEYGGIKQLVGDATTRFRDVALRRVVEPTTALKDDLLLNKRRPGLADPKALQDAEASLEKMLEDWLADTSRRLSKDQRAKLAQAHDMSTVSEVLAQETRSAVKNLLSGNIVRALLLQLQFVTCEVYDGLNKLDDLLAANQATIQVLALFPAVFLAVTAVRLVRALVVALASESVKSTQTVVAEMAAVLNEAARLVLLAPPDRPLDAPRLGALALHAHTLRTRAYKERARFNPNRLARLDRALCDLFRPGLTAAQIRELLLSIIWDHEFLRLATNPVVPPPLGLLPNDGPSSRLRP